MLKTVISASILVGKKPHLLMPLCLVKVGLLVAVRPYRALTGSEGSHDFSPTHRVSQQLLCATFTPGTHTYCGAYAPYHNDWSSVRPSCMSCCLMGHSMRVITEALFRDLPELKISSITSCVRLHTPNGKTFTFSGHKALALIILFPRLMVPQSLGLGLWGLFSDFQSRVFP